MWEEYDEIGKVDLWPRDAEQSLRHRGQLWCGQEAVDDNVDAQNRNRVKENAMKPCKIYAARRNSDPVGMKADIFARLAIRLRLRHPLK